MAWLWAAVLTLVLLGSVLAVAEASVGRMNRIRAMALREEGRRNAALLERIESDPARHLNFLAVTFVQNGSAILVAILAERSFGNLGVTLISAGFTLAYFVVVEAMSKTFGILHSDRAALALAPVVWSLGRALTVPTRALIGLANVLLPGKGLERGPFVLEHELRSMAEVGHQEGVIEEQEKQLIHSILRFGDTVVREVMVPRPDVVAAEIDMSLGTVQDLVLKHGFSRIPVYRKGLDRIEGIVYAKDMLRALRQERHDMPLAEMLRPAHFVPESKRVGDLLRQMQRERFHMALVTDEYGSLSGLVTLEDLLEELVGEIADEYDREEPRMQLVGEECYRVNGRISIDDLNTLLGAHLPHGQWDTVAGLVVHLLGSVPGEGQEVRSNGLRFKVEKVHGRRIATLLITRLSQESTARG